MKSVLSLVGVIFCALALAGCSSNSLFDARATKAPASTAESSSTPVESSPQQTIPLAEEDAMPTITIEIGGKRFPATLYDNESARAIAGEMSFTLEMDDFSLQEKVTALAFALPSAQAEIPATINAGDLYLWSGNNFVLF